MNLKDYLILSLHEIESKKKENNDKIEKKSNYYNSQAPLIVIFTLLVNFNLLNAFVTENELIHSAINILSLIVAYIISYKIFFIKIIFCEKSNIIINDSDYNEIRKTNFFINFILGTFIVFIFIFSVQFIMNEILHTYDMHILKKVYSEYGFSYFVSILAIILINVCASFAHGILKDNIILLNEENEKLKPIDTKHYIELKTLMDTSPGCPQIIDFVNSIKLKRDFITNEEFETIKKFRIYFDTEYLEKTKAEAAYQNIMK